MEFQKEPEVTLLQELPCLTTILVSSASAKDSVMVLAGPVESPKKYDSTQMSGSPIPCLRHLSEQVTLNIMT